MNDSRKHGRVTIALLLIVIAGFVVMILGLAISTYRYIRAVDIKKPAIRIAHAEIPSKFSPSLSFPYS